MDENARRLTELLGDGEPSREDVWSVVNSWLPKLHSQSFGWPLLVDRVADLALETGQCPIPLTTEPGCPKRRPAAMLWYWLRLGWLVEAASLRRLLDVEEAHLRDELEAEQGIHAEASKKARTATDRDLLYAAETIHEAVGEAHRIKKRLDIAGRAPTVEDVRKATAEAVEIAAGIDPVDIEDALLGVPEWVRWAERAAQRREVPTVERLSRGAFFVGLPDWPTSPLLLVHEGSTLSGVRERLTDLLSSLRHGGDVVLAVRLFLQGARRDPLRRFTGGPQIAAVFMQALAGLDLGERATGRPEPWEPELADLVEHRRDLTRSATLVRRCLSLGQEAWDLEGSTFAVLASAERDLHQDVKAWLRPYLAVEDTMPDPMDFERFIWPLLPGNTGAPILERLLVEPAPAPASGRPDGMPQEEIDRRVERFRQIREGLEQKPSECEGCGRITQVEPHGPPGSFRLLCAECRQAAEGDPPVKN